MQKVVIIGAGASGIMAGIVLGKASVDTVILDRMEKPLKKVSATGNGKCNFTNMDISKDNYPGNGDFAVNIIDKFNNIKVIDFFKACKIASINLNNYVYPYSRKASTVVNQLLECINEYSCVSFKNNTNVKKILHKENGKYIVEYEEKLENKEFTRRSIEADYVIIATGGQSDKNLGSDGSGFYFAKLMNHTIKEPIPALVPLHLKRNYKDVSGVRVLARIVLCVDEEEVCSEYGEIIFNEKGVSGIPIFQISSRAIRASLNGNKVEIKIDFIDGLADEVVFDVIGNNGKFINFNGILPEKLGKYLSENKNISIEEAVNLLHNYKDSVIGWDDFNKSQVTSGGVNLNEVDENTLESKLHEGLFFSGEVLDVDGVCGGYNLQWAWSTGYVVGNVISERIKK